MRKLKILAIGFMIGALLGLLIAFAGGARAATYPTSTPNPPAGWHQTYAHNFVTQGWGDWTVCTDCGGAVHPTPSISDYTKPGAEFGLGIKLTGPNQWGEVWSKNNTVGPNSFVKAIVFIPASGGKIANWPAWWTTPRPSPWPQGGEIDAFEGLGGTSHFGTHYGTWTGTAPSGNSSGGSATVTGWVTVTFERTGGKVTTWYNNRKIGTANLPPTTPERLVFQNRSFVASQANDFGPLLPATAYVSRVTVWSK